MSRTTWRVVLAAGLVALATRVPCAWATMSPEKTEEVRETTSEATEETAEPNAIHSVLDASTYSTWRGYTIQFANIIAAGGDPSDSVALITAVRHDMKLNPSLIGANGRAEKVINPDSLEALVRLAPVTGEAFQTAAAILPVLGGVGVVLLGTTLAAFGLMVIRGRPPV